MSIHLQKEMGKLKKKFLSLSAIVEENLHTSLDAVMRNNIEPVKQICEKDIKIDSMEVEIEEDCLKILALHQPVAVDLRFIVAILKINNDLERIGDQAVNIANKIKRMTYEKLPYTFDFREMGKSVQQMLKLSLDALINLDVETARAVCQMDDAVDEMKKEIRKRVFATINEYPHHITGMFAILGVARNLERIADLTTNIAEDVIYMVEGNIVRHKVEEQ